MITNNRIIEKSNTGINILKPYNKTYNINVSKRLVVYFMIFKVLFYQVFYPIPPWMITFVDDFHTY